MESKHRDLHVCATPPPPRLRRFKKPRKTNVQLDGHFGDCSPLFFRGVHISTRPKTLIFAYSFQSLKYPGLPARDDGRWHMVWCQTKLQGWMGWPAPTAMYLYDWCACLAMKTLGSNIVAHQKNVPYTAFACECPILMHGISIGSMPCNVSEHKIRTIAGCNCWEGPEQPLRRPSQKKNQIKFLVSCVIFMLPHHAKHHEKQL